MSWANKEKKTYSLSDNTILGLIQTYGAQSIKERRKVFTGKLLGRRKWDFRRLDKQTRV